MVGDVHEAWSQQDAQALNALRPDAVLLVGDFGEEVVNLVAEIAAQIQQPYAAILGNHDAVRLPCLLQALHKSMLRS